MIPSVPERGVFDMLELAGRRAATGWDDARVRSTAVSTSTKNVLNRSVYAIYVWRKCVCYVYSLAKRLLTLHHVLLDCDQTGVRRLALQIDSFNSSSCKRTSDRA